MKAALTAALPFASYACTTVQSSSHRGHAPVLLHAWSPNPWALVAITAGVAGVLLGLLLSLFAFSGPGYRYHLWRWEAETLTSNLFTRIGIGPDGASEGQPEALQRYFALTSRVRAELELPQPDRTLIDTLISERAAYENDVERLIEHRIGDAIQQAGLQEPLPLFGEVKVTWPPVDIELTSPPRLLVRSPRDRIERKGDTLLKNDLALRQIEEIERETTSDTTVSLVVSIGGLAAYPAIVRDDRSYDALLDTSAHEWVHHYLAFHPLGQKWGDGGDSETLNETTASIAGRELANLVRGAHPEPLPADADGRAPAAPPATIDYNEEMRRLRLEVDALLAGGRVEEAERTMEERRLFFAENGIYIRKINQAFFAFYGTYADGPASSNPIGPKIERVWELTRDVGQFLRLMRNVETARELDDLLSRLEATGAGK